MSLEIELSDQLNRKMNNLTQNQREIGREFEENWRVNLCGGGVAGWIFRL